MSHEPLTYFVLLGAAVFLAYRLLHPALEQQRVIVVSDDVVTLLRSQLMAANQAEPTARQLAAAIDQFVEEEMLVRHARELGLDKSDPIVRRRLVQKVRFLFEDHMPGTAPSEAELLAYYQAHPGAYREPARVSFQQVFRADTQAGASGHDCAQLKRQLEAGANADELGDPFTLGRKKAAQTRQQVERVFGADMAGQLFSVQQQQWQGPFQSRYGCHLVKVTERTPAQVPGFDAVRDRVQGDWQREQVERHKQQALDFIRTGYQVKRLDHAALHPE